MVNASHRSGMKGRETWGLFSGIPVLGAFEGVEYGAELLVARGLELLQGGRTAGYGREARGEAGTVPGGECAPGEEAVGTFQYSGRRTRLEQTLEGGVQGVGLF